MKKLFLLAILVCLWPFNARAEENLTISDNITSPVVRIISAKDFKLIKDFYPFGSESLAQGANIVTADLDNNGSQEIIVAAGRNEQPLVKIFDYQGNLKNEFLAYDATFTDGIKIAVADLYNDKSPEIIVSAAENGGAQIRVFDNLGFVYFSFFAFDDKERHGANVTVGDVNGDSQKEIIVGAGYGKEAIIKIFDNYSNFLGQFYAYEKEFKGGVNVLAVDLDNNGIDEIVTAPYVGKEPRVKIFDQKGTLINQFLAYPAGFWGGVNLAKGDLDKDGWQEIITGAGYSGSAHVRIFDSQGTPKINPKLFIFDNFKGGISVAGGDLNNDKETEILAATQTISPNGKYNSYKIIEIDLTKQKLYTYFKGQPVNEFIISSGKWKFPTPQGTFKIRGKTLKGTMTGYYGPDNPDNYSLPNVPHIMPFYKNYAIHGAYWHWSFGRRVSHGCINLKLKDAETVYKWTDVGVPVIIYSSKK